MGGRGTRTVATGLRAGWTGAGTRPTTLVPRRVHTWSALRAGKNITG